MNRFRVILGDAELSGESERPLPVDRAKLIVLARARISAVTWSCATSKMIAAVWR